MTLGVRDRRPTPPLRASGSLEGVGCMVCSLGSRAEVLGRKAEGSEFRVQGSGFWVFGFRDWGLGFKAEC